MFFFSLYADHGYGRAYNEQTSYIVYKSYTFLVLSSFFPHLCNSAFILSDFHIVFYEMKMKQTKIFDKSFFFCFNFFFYFFANFFISIYTNTLTKMNRIVYLITLLQCFYQYNKTGVNLKYSI